MALLPDFEFRGGAVIAKPSGTRIPLRPSLALDLWRGMSFVWVVQLIRLWRLVTGRKARARIAFFPQAPRSYYAAWPVSQLARVKIVREQSDADILFFFHDTPQYDAPFPQAGARPVLNGACRDVRKTRVAQVFAETFGYPLAIEPKTYQGPAVEKSEGNGVHDGRIVHCPLPSPNPNRVYQKLIDNTSDGAEFVDLRTPVVGGEIPFVYLKKRTRTERFSNNNHGVDLARPEDIYSPVEIDRITAFAAAMGLDFGGLDVLRDRADGRLYVVDVNKTDMGPPTAMSGMAKLRAMCALADAFARLVDRRLER